MQTFYKMEGVRLNPSEGLRCLVSATFFCAIGACARTRVSVRPSPPHQWSRQLRAASAPPNVPSTPDRFLSVFLPGSSTWLTVLANNSDGGQDRRKPRWDRIGGRRSDRKLAVTARQAAGQSLHQSLQLANDFGEWTASGKCLPNAGLHGPSVDGGDVAYAVATPRPAREHGVLTDF